jgi:hypothetical protein
MCVYRSPACKKLKLFAFIFGENHHGHFRINLIPASKHLLEVPLIEPPSPCEQIGISPSIKCTRDFIFLLNSSTCPFVVLPNRTMSNEEKTREAFVYLTKLAENSERYDGT